MRPLLLVLCLAACGGGPIENACGVTSWETLEGYDALLSKVLFEFSRVDAPRFKDACKNLNGYSIEIRNDWTDYGETHCGPKRIAIGTNALDANSALAHEMAHAVDNCERTHEQWNSIGLWYAVYRAEGTIP